MIYKFEPILKTLVWGTENWVLSGVKGNETKVVGGPADGKTLNELYGGEFPLLIKFINAKKDLSIQVHPDDEVARQRHGCRGKTEMWYIIGATPDAHLLAGLKEEITPEDYVRLVGDGSITGVLADHRIAPGDVFFLPAGRIHAICGGCYLAEIQETSDITYRIFDYNRPGLDGKPRQLHTQEAKDVIDYKVYPDYKTAYTPKENAGVEIVKCSHFTTDLYELTKATEVNLEGLASVEGNFLVVMGLEGKGVVRIAGANESAASISEGQAVLVIGEKEISFEPESPKLKLLTTHL
jgi:mannose-6-phosphate isomerase